MSGQTRPDGRRFNLKEHRVWPTALEYTGIGKINLKEVGVQIVMDAFTDYLAGCLRIHL